MGKPLVGASLGVQKLGFGLSTRHSAVVYKLTDEMWLPPLKSLWLISEGGRSWPARREERLFQGGIIFKGTET